jgi:hypothetical protein
VADVRVLLRQVGEPGRIPVQRGRVVGDRHEGFTERRGARPDTDLEEGQHRRRDALRSQLLPARRSRAACDERREHGHRPRAASCAHQNPTSNPSRRLRPSA